MNTTRSARKLVFYVIWSFSIPGYQISYALKLDFFSYFILREENPAGDVITTSFINKNTNGPEMNCFLGLHGYKKR